MKLNKEKENLILEQVKQAQASAEGDHNLQQARWNESYLYYTGELPKLSAEEKAAGITELFTEPVLYNATNSAIPQILDAFTEDDSLAVAFRSKGAMRNPALENLITTNMNKIVLHDQDGYQLIENMIRETLITGDCFGKVYIDETKITESVQVDEYLELSEFLSNIAENWFIDAPGFGIELKGNYRGFEWKTKQAHSVDQQGNPVLVPVIYVKGNVPIAKVDSKIAIEQVESKDLWADNSAGHDFNRCPFICHRVETTVGEAELRGYDKEKLKAASDNDKADELPTLYFSGAFAGIPGNVENNNSTDPKQKRIYLYENYIKSSLLNRKGETRCYQVITTGSEVLKVTEITRELSNYGARKMAEAESLTSGRATKGYDESAYHEQQTPRQIQEAREETSVLAGKQAKSAKAGESAVLHILSGLSLVKFAPFLVSAGYSRVQAQAIMNDLARTGGKNLTADELRNVLGAFAQGDTVKAFARGYGNEVTRKETERKRKVQGWHSGI